MSLLRNLSHSDIVLLKALHGHPGVSTGLGGEEASLAKLTQNESFGNIQGVGLQSPRPWKTATRHSRSLNFLCEILGHFE